MFLFLITRLESAILTHYNSFVFVLHYLGNTGFIKNLKKAVRLFMAENSSRSYHVDYLKIGVFSRKYHCVLALFFYSLLRVSGVGHC